MNIFNGNLTDQINKFKNVPLLYTIMENSTSTVQSYFSNVCFNEEEITSLMYCEGDIIEINSNFGHIKANVEQAPKKRKSNRGRKAKPKPVKNRKKQGDGSSLNSQITFTIMGKVHRVKRNNPDKHSENAVISVVNTSFGTKYYETFYKPYKIKLFRNGKIIVTGVLNEDLSDIKTPLNTLLNFIRKFLLVDTKILFLYSVMRNYLFRVKEGKIDVKKLHQHCNNQFQNLLNTSISDIKEFLINPIFENSNGINPNNLGWYNFLNEVEINTNLNISYTSLMLNLKESKNNKNLYVKKNKLIKHIESIPLEPIYNKIKNFVYLIQRCYFVNFNENVIKLLLKYILNSYFVDLEYKLKKSKDNLLSFIVYDPEKYPGLLLKIKTPNIIDKNKITTIKIFPSGKINIDGANSRHEAEFIYYWLNNLFYENPEFIYDPNNINYDDSDSEYSSESEPEQNN